MSRQILITGNSNFAVDAPFDVAPNSVVYLGRVSGVNRERSSSDDQSTGGVIPIIDQAVSGFGAGTLEVSLGDNYAEDVKVLKQEYASMQNLELVRSPLKFMMLERTTGSRAAPLVVTYPAGEKSAVKAAQAESGNLPTPQSLRMRNDSR